MNASRFMFAMVWLISACGAPPGRATSAERDGPSQLDAEAARALDHAFTYLEDRIATLSLDAVFLLRMAEGAFPGSRAGAIATRALPAALNDPAYADPSLAQLAGLVEGPRPPGPARALPPGAVTGRPDPQQPFDEPFSDQCLIGALECRWAPGCQDWELKPGQWGYTLSHQVLFFQLVNESGCDATLGVDSQAHLGALSRAMLAEQRADPVFSDLYAERVGLAAQAGYRELLTDDVVRTILASEQPGGCWRPEPSHPECTDHTTGMVAWVLSLHLGRQR